MAKLIDPQERSDRPHLPRPGDDGFRKGPRLVSVRGVLAGLFVLVASGVCVSLGFWQLDRLEQRRANNAALVQALSEPVLELDAELAARLSRDPDAYRFRRVRLRGRYSPASDVLLRARAYAGQPGVHLFSPLRLEGADVAVMVNRGWLPAPDAATADPRPYGEAGVVELEGLLQLFPPVEGLGVPAEREFDGFRVLSLSRLDRSELQARTAEPLAAFYVQHLPGDATADFPVRLDLPALDEGSHLNYAVQWFGFAAVFLIGFAVVVVRNGVAESSAARSDPAD